MIMEPCFQRPHALIKHVAYIQAEALEENGDYARLEMRLKLEESINRTRK